MENTMTPNATLPKHGETLPEGERRHIVNIHPGDGATRHVGSDRYPFTVIAVSRGRAGGVECINRMLVQRDDVECKEGVVTIRRNVNTPEVEVTLRRNGRWVAKGDDLNATGAFTFGARESYYDPHF